MAQFFWSHIFMTSAISDFERIYNSIEEHVRKFPKVPYSEDLDCLQRFKNNVISGYLNLSAAEGWEESHDPRLGVTFARYILTQYIAKNKHLSKNQIVFEKAAQAFKNAENLFVQPKTFPSDFRPKESRISFDSSVTGWQNHSVTHLIGNVGSTYNPSKPFFEILINSARSSLEDPVCHPFFISVHANEEELEKRRIALQKLKSVPEKIAGFSFYATYLKKPDEFLKLYQKKLGPNATRLLNALIHLQNEILPAQKTGNCWMKQPMRSLLTALYVELITHRLDLTYAAAWTEAKKLYKEIQKTVAIPVVKSLIDESDASIQMKRAALRSLEKQKKL
jgi:hypothetical protein